jgi:hypothetical protein
MRILQSTLLLFVLLAGCSTAPKSDFVVTDHPIFSPVVGVGACMNPYLYAYPNTPQEINPQAMGDLETKVGDLHPQFVRIFFLNSWWYDDTDNSVAKDKPGMRESVVRTIELAQRSGAKVLLQLWYDPTRYENPDDVARKFANAIAALRRERGLTAIRFASIQNEPNEFDKDITPQKYVQVYRALDRALRDLKLRDDVRIIGGDLVYEHQKHWFELLGAQLADVLDGYSIHVYWDYWDIERFRRHIQSVNEVMAKMPARQRRPIYVTEFGAQGFRDRPEIEPGKSTDGKPLADVPVYSFEIGIFILESINCGYIGFAQWDMYDVWYDRKMGYGVIGSVENHFPIKPGFHLMQLFTRGVEPGWRAMKINGEVEDVWVTALKGNRDEMSLFILNRVKGDKQVTIGGLPKNRRLNVWRWNADGTGTLAQIDSIVVGNDGTIARTIPNMCIELLTTK